jgi:hypothetical protein
MKLRLAVIILIVSFSCRKPMDAYNKTILKNGYIPFSAPVSDTLPGSLFTDSSPDDLIFAGMHDECFPAEYLRIKRSIDIPDEYKKVSFNSKLDLSPIVNSGNSILDFNYQSSRVKEVKLEMEGASLEGFSLRAFARYFLGEIEEYCREDLLSDDLSFVLGSMKIDSLSFSFKNNANGEIKLTSDNLKQFVSLNYNVKWEIINETTLTVKTPKYIGYHMAKIKQAADGSYLLFIANSNGHDESKFNYRHRYTITRKTRSGSGSIIAIGDDSDLKMYLD